MEFKFNINDVFKHPVVEINQSLIPPGFGGDRRALWDTVNKVTEVVNAMGEASAVAQGLTKPITTAERLRNSEHKLYLLIDQNASNGKGAVTGMLKTGSKGLYVFDRDGQHYQVSPPCVLDFYIHESRQRTGLGKKLFEHMLEKEQIIPVQMAIDRPSDKFLGFLNKHYALNSPVKQMNNYVVFDGFFPKQPEDTHNMESSKSRSPVRKNSANGLQAYASPVGRYGAHRPPCSMGQIIHNQTSTINKRQEPAGVQSMPVTNYQGIRYSPQQPNPYVSQSVPNIQYGERLMNENCYPDKHYVPQEGRLQGLDLNELPTSFQNQMRLNGQQSTPQNSNQMSNFIPAQSYVNVPGQTVTAEGGYGYGPVQSYPNSTDLNSNNITGQQIVGTKPPQSLETANVQQNSNVQTMTPQHVPQMNNVNEGNNIPPNLNANQTHDPINATSGQQVYRTSEQQNINTAIQSQYVLEKSLLNESQANQNQIHGIPSTPNNTMNVLPAQSIHQPPPNLLQTQNVHQQLLGRQPTANPVVYETAPQLSQPHTVERSLNPTPHPFAMHQQPLSNNLPRMLDGSTPAAQNYHSIPHQQPASQMVSTAARAEANQLDGATPIVQNYYPNQNPQPSPVNNTVSDMPTQLPQQRSIQNPVQQNPSEPASNPNQAGQYQQSLNYIMSSDNALNQPPPQQGSTHNKLQMGASMAAVNALQNTYQQQLITAINSTPPSDQVTNLPVSSQTLPNQINQMRHFPLPPGQQLHQSPMNVPLGYQHHQSVMNLPLGHQQHQNSINLPLGHQQHQSAINLQGREAASQNLIQPNSIMQNSTKLIDQSVWDHNLRGVGQFGDSAQQNPVMADAQRGVNQSYSVPNVYASYQNSPQYAPRGVSAQRPGNNVGDSRNVKEVSEEGVLKYGYPVQMTNNVQNDVDPNPVKLERPRSLTIQTNEEPAEENVQVIEETKAVEDEIDVGKINLEGDKVEEIIEALPGGVPPGFEDDPSSARKTPSHLTDQGYFDLKFYHNKLW